MTLVKSYHSYPFIPGMYAVIDEHCRCRSHSCDHPGFTRLIRVTPGAPARALKEDYGPALLRWERYDKFHIRTELHPTNWDVLYG